MMKQQRLSKVLAAHGIASRRACEKLIFSKRVRVNGKTVCEPQTLVNADVDTILIDRKPLQSLRSYVYLAFNKPRGFVCSHNKDAHKKVIYDLLGDEPARLFSAGRLDKETTGLLIVTSDGHFAHHIAHPSSNILKEYIVKTDKEIVDTHLKVLKEGCSVEGVWVVPHKVTKVRKGTLKIIVSEGRKREVRELVENADLKVLHLKRVAVGPLRLGSLKEGSYRPLTEREKELLLKPSSPAFTKTDL